MTLDATRLAIFFFGFVAGLALVGLVIEWIDDRRATSALARKARKAIEPGSALAQMKAEIDARALAGRREELTSRATPGPAPARRADLGSRVRQSSSNGHGEDRDDAAYERALKTASQLGTTWPPPRRERRS
jgi:hypothetical protein